MIFNVSAAGLLLDMKDSGAKARDQLKDSTREMIMLAGARYPKPVQSI